VGQNSHGQVRKAHKSSLSLLLLTCEYSHITQPLIQLYKKGKQKSIVQLLFHMYFLVRGRHHFMEVEGEVNLFKAAKTMRGKNRGKRRCGDCIEEIEVLHSTAH